MIPARALASKLVVGQRPPLARLLSWTACRSLSSSSSSSSASSSSSEFVSHMKNPIVHQLWTARGEAKQQAADCGKEIDLTTPRVPSQSTTSISYPFASEDFLKETYRNPWGQVRFGKILEDLDALAGNIAFAHVQDPRLTLVTASVDRIRLTGTPSVDQDQHLSGQVTFVGTSSMEIRIDCANSSGKEWMEAYFTFVATDPFTKRPVKIPPLQPETTEEIALFELGQQRAALRKQARQQGKGSKQGDPEIEQKAIELLKEAGPLLNMPSLANPYSILVRQTELQTAEIAQPQVRNLANQIFGGFLMRRACELAYSTAYVFGGKRPTFFEVDQVSFGMPVNVGDLTNFHARVLYTTVKDSLPEFDSVELDGKSQIPLVSVEVEAWIIDPEQATAKLSNQFYFTFALPPTPIRTVLPSNMDEARTMAMRMAADKAQEEDDA